MANAAGRIPRSRRAVHQAAARPGSAFGKTAKNFHSLRPVSDWSTTVFCHRRETRRGVSDRGFPDQSAVQDAFFRVISKVRSRAGTETVTVIWPSFNVPL